jgi:hypothetical protein
MSSVNARIGISEVARWAASTARHDHVDIGTNEFRCVYGEFRTAQSKAPLVDDQISPFDKTCAPKFATKGQMMRRITRSRKQAGQHDG